MKLLIYALFYVVIAYLGIAFVMLDLPPPVWEWSETDRLTYLACMFAFVCFCRAFWE